MQLELDHPRILKGFHFAVVEDELRVVAPPDGRVLHHRFFPELRVSLLNLHLHHGGVLVHFPHILLILPLHLLEVDLVLLVLLSQLAHDHGPLALGLLVLQLTFLGESLYLLVSFSELAEQVFVRLLGEWALVERGFELLDLLVILLVFL